MSDTAFRDYHGRMLPGHPQPKREGSSQWKGGRLIDSKGYVRVLNPGHPKQDSRGYVKEHLLIAERVVGRPLPRSVHVHHFNEVRSDNSNGNLVICENAAYHALLHARQRVKAAGGNPDRDLICFRCKAVKDIEQFCRDKGAPICRMGRNGRCRSCCREMDELNRERDGRRNYARQHERDPLLGTRRPGSGRKAKYA